MPPCPFPRGLGMNALLVAGCALFSTHIIDDLQVPDHSLRDPMETSSRSSKVAESGLAGGMSGSQSQPDLEAASAIPQTYTERPPSIGSKGHRTDEIPPESEGIEIAGNTHPKLPTNMAETEDAADINAIRRRIRFENPWKSPNANPIAMEDESRSPGDVSPVTRHARNFDSTQILRRTGTGMTQINLPYLSFTASIGRNSVRLFPTCADYTELL